MLINFKKYLFLMQQMILRDFKVKYKRSILGVLWSLLNPLLMMSVMSVVFSQVLKFNIEGISNYLVYLLSGLIMFNYFSEATNLAMVSIVDNFQLMTKVYIPKYVFPLSKCLFASINLFLSIIPLLLIVLLTGAPITWNYLFIPYALLCLILFSFGIGLIISTISVFLRDMFHLYSIIVLIWQYFTPIFYVAKNTFDPFLLGLLQLNPLYQYINFTRIILLDGATPPLISFVICGATAIIVALIGCFAFRAKQNKFIYYA